MVRYIRFFDRGPSWRRRLCRVFFLLALMVLCIVVVAPVYVSYLNEGERSQDDVIAYQLTSDDINALLSDPTHTGDRIIVSGYVTSVDLVNSISKLRFKFSPSGKYVSPTGLFAQD